LNHGFPRKRSLAHNSGYSTGDEVYATPGPFGIVLREKVAVRLHLSGSSLTI
jgi:hypothetical protein